jgi:hypothetical protein
MTGPSADDLRERTREQILTAMGGWSGTIIAAIPPVVFVIVNAIAHLRMAIYAAVGTGVLIAGYRLVRRQSLQQAATGLFSVLIAALIAHRTGQARGFFLLGIAGSFVYGAIFAISLVVRRPLVGVLWEYLDPAPLPPGTKWYRVPRLRRGYDLATLAVLAMFASRAIVQFSLFRDNRTGWLAVTRVAMGFPLYLAVVGIAFWVVRRARQQLPPLPAAELPAESPADLPDAFPADVLPVDEPAHERSSSRPASWDGTAADPER